MPVRISFGGKGGWKETRLNSQRIQPRQRGRTGAALSRPDNQASIVLGTHTIPCAFHFRASLPSPFTDSLLHVSEICPAITATFIAFDQVQRRDTSFGRPNGHVQRDGSRSRGEPLDRSCDAVAAERVARTLYRWPSGSREYEPFVRRSTSVTERRSETAAGHRSARATCSPGGGGGRVGGGGGGGGGKGPAAAVPPHVSHVARWRLPATFGAGRLRAGPGWPPGRRSVCRRKHVKCGCGETRVALGGNSASRARAAGLLLAAFPGARFATPPWSRIPAWGQLHPEASEESARKGHYAWKAAIVAERLARAPEGACVLWLDAEVQIGAPGLHRFCTGGGGRRLCPASTGTLRQWTSSATLDAIDAQTRAGLVAASIISDAGNGAIVPADSTAGMCDAGMVAFVGGSPTAQQIVRAWLACSLKRRCIAPRGSNRANHRQDQTALSLVVYSLSPAAKESRVTSSARCVEARAAAW